MIFLIAGATAVGKSALAVALAQQINGVVINADSMQCYAGLPVLSAQPTQAERAHIDHYLYGFASGCTPFTIAHWLDAVAALLNTITRPVVIVGGTGLYFQALCNGLATIPAICPQVRQQVRALTPLDAHNALQLHDARAASILHPNDTQRIKRALEVVLATGHTLHYWQQQTSTPVLANRKWHGVVLEMPRPQLYQRIDARFMAMLQQGAAAEVAAIPNAQSVLWQTLGARELAQWHSGALTAEQALQQAQTLSRNYAKQQITRFKNMLPHWPRLQAAANNVDDLAARCIFNQNVL